MNHVMREGRSLMNEREQVRREGGVFSINNAPEFLQEGGLRAKLVLTPNTGTRMVGLTAGFHEPGQSFEPHRHPLSEEVLIVVRGKGQIFLKDRWIDVEEGDVVYAPEGILHGTGNPDEFVTIGCAAPPQLDLYQRIGYKLVTEDPMIQG
jgi:quercetin dioxygenase-like cupin family protein